MARADFNYMDIMKDIMKVYTLKIKIKGRREFHFRLKLFLFVLSLAKWILPIKTKIDFDLAKDE